MKTTITAFRADLGGVGGHLQPSRHVCQTVSDYVTNDLKGLLIDADVSFTGDDIIKIVRELGNRFVTRKR